VEILLGSAAGEAGARAIVNQRLAVPAHFDVEVYAAFRRLFRRGVVDRARLGRSAALLAAFPAERVALTPLLSEAHRLAERVSAHDAFYVALARARGNELVTADALLAEAAAGLARVRVIAAE
jgi:predicted nucleic acid-binding protein